MYHISELELGLVCDPGLRASGEVTQAMPPRVRCFSRVGKQAFQHPSPATPSMTFAASPHRSSRQLGKRKIKNLVREREIDRLRKMGSETAEIKCLRKVRLLCLHGFRTSAEIIKKQVTGKWPESVLEKLDLVFVDAPFPCQGKSDVEGIFDPPYYEWFQFNKEFKEYQNFDECLAYIEECMIKHGPFDGLLGFSQGAILSAALAGMQANGAALTRVPKLKLVVIIGGAKFSNPSVAEKAYASPIQCRSVHFLGDQDFLKQHGTELLDSFVDPLVIQHPKGHTIPRFDDKGLASMHAFLERLQKDAEDEKKQQIGFQHSIDH